MRFAILGAAGALLLAACSDVTNEGETLNFAVFTVLGKAGPSQGQVVATPSGFFFRSDNVSLPSSIGTENQCAVQNIGGSGGSDFRFVNPGDPVGYSFGTTSGQLSPDDDQSTTYLADGPVTFFAGANVTFTVPGADGGFSAGSITAKTAEPVTVDPITLEVDDVEGGIPVTWSPSGDADSKLVIVLQYGTGPTRNQQVICAFQDDGEDVIPQGALGGYLEADNTLNTAYRLRTTTVRSGDDVMHVYSTFELPLEVVEPPEELVARR